MKVATLARKPITLPNVAQNIIRHWAGAINIDAARVPRAEDYYEKCISVVGLSSNTGTGVYGEWEQPRQNSWHEQGAWPANVLVLGEPLAALQDKARYFKRAPSLEELLAYFQEHLSPPSERVQVAPEDPSWNPPEGSPGLVVPWAAGESTLRRWHPLLRPGAHLIVLSSDGIDVASDLETVGFEIRDAILILEESKGLHYCPKASARERNAGVPLSQAKMKVWRYFPTDDIDTECPAEGFPIEEVPPDLVDFFVAREVSLPRRHSNHHATVKPLALMADLMAGLPPEAVIVDPFLGSGSTAVAALIKGHSCIGIERDVEEGYLRIARARVDFWCPAHALVRSEVEEVQEEFELWR